MEMLFLIPAFAAAVWLGRHPIGTHRSQAVAALAVVASCAGVSLLGPHPGFGVMFLGVAVLVAGFVSLRRQAFGDPQRWRGLVMLIAGGVAMFVGGCLLDRTLLDRVSANAGTVIVAFVLAVGWGLFRLWRVARWPQKIEEGADRHPPRVP